MTTLKNEKLKTLLCYTGKAGRFLGAASLLLLTGTMLFSPVGAEEGLSLKARSGMVVKDDTASEPSSENGQPAQDNNTSAPKEETLLYDMVRLQGLNKVTARISTLESPVGAVMRFGNLEIIVRTCWQSPPSSRPEDAALLDVWELKPGEKPERVFTGWMFSSSPAISAMEHPVYDLVLLDCLKKGASAIESGSAEAEREKAIESLPAAPVPPANAAASEKADPAAVED